MPEGPEVEHIVSDLERECVEKFGYRLDQLTLDTSLDGPAIEFSFPKLLKYAWYDNLLDLDKSLKARELALQYRDQAKWTNWTPMLQRTGKHLFLTFTPHLKVADQITVAMHFSMTGWLSWDPVEPKFQKYVRATIHLRHRETDQKMRLVFTDVRKFGRMCIGEGLYGQKMIQSRIKDRLGPDSLTESSKLSYALENGRKAFGKLTIKTALMDQALISGLGNVYVTEVLWDLKLHPEENYLNALEIVGSKALADACYTHSKRGYDFKTVEVYAHVYGRAGMPCKRCATILSSKIIDTRNTSFCSQCQQLQHQKIR